MDRAAICRPQSRQAGGEGLSVRDPIASIVGGIPHRMALAGGTRKVALGLWGGEVPVPGALKVRVKTC